MENVTAHNINKILSGANLFIYLLLIFEISLVSEEIQKMWLRRLMFFEI